MRVVTFGEVMIRLAPPGWLRLGQVLPGALEATFGGAEVNVAVSIAVQGGRSAFCTALPDNPLTDAFLQELRRYGVDTDLVHRVRDGRFGMYFVETGANQRSSTVTYDRAGSSIAVTPAAAYDWAKILDGATRLHITGITPAVSAAAAEASLAAAQAAAERRIPVSCDLNFRKKLWNWEPGTKPAALARRVMEQLLAHVSLLIANEEDAEQVLGIRAGNTNVEQGMLDPAGYVDVARQIAARFPRIQQVAITLRESLSASHNNWGGLLYDRAADRAWLAPTDAAGSYQPYAITHIVDRVGAGDAFGGALLFALDQPDLSAPETALRYAVAASCLKHSIVGDFNCSTRAEIEALVRGGGAGPRAALIGLPRAPHLAGIRPLVTTPQHAPPFHHPCPCGDGSCRNPGRCVSRERAAAVCAVQPRLRTGNRVDRRRTCRASGRLRHRSRSANRHRGGDGFSAAAGSLAGAQPWSPR